MMVHGATWVVMHDDDGAAWCSNEAASTLQLQAQTWRRDMARTPEPGLVIHGLADPSLDAVCDAYEPKHVSWLWVAQVARLIEARKRLL